MLSSGGRRLRPRKKNSSFDTPISRSNTAKYTRAASPSCPRISSSRATPATVSSNRPSRRAACSKSSAPSAVGFSRSARNRTVRQFAIFAITTERATAAARSSRSAQRYCSRRNSTLPDTGPWTRAKNRPFSVRNASATLLSPHRPIRNGLHDTFPKHTMLLKVWIGTRSLVSFSTRTATASPSRARYAPCVVTYSVLSNCFRGPPLRPGKRLPDIVSPWSFSRLLAASTGRTANTSRTSSHKRPAA